MLNILDSTQLEGVYDDLIGATEEVHNCNEAALAARSVLNQEIGGAILGGRLDGKNEPTREAQARTLFADTYATVARADSNLRAAKYNLDICRLRVEHVRAQLRLAEVVAMAQSESEVL